MFTNIIYKYWFYLTIALGGTFYHEIWLLRIIYVPYLINKTTDVLERVSECIYLHSNIGYNELKSHILKKNLFPEKALPHWLHWYGCSPVYVLLRSRSREKVLSHWLHIYGLSPVFVIKWAVRWLLDENYMSHWLHLCGFSPVCVLRWRVSHLMTTPMQPLWWSFLMQRS